VRGAGSGSTFGGPSQSKSRLGSLATRTRRCASVRAVLVAVLATERALRLSPVPSLRAVGRGSASQFSASRGIAPRERSLRSQSNRAFQRARVAWPKWWPFPCHQRSMLPAQRRAKTGDDEIGCAWQWLACDIDLAPCGGRGGKADPTSSSSAGYQLLTQRSNRVVPSFATGSNAASCLNANGFPRRRRR